MNPVAFSTQDAMRAVYKASPYFLGKEVLGYSRFCETQIEWSEHATTTYNPNHPLRTWSLVLAPRETLKSTFWTVTEIIRILLNNPNLTILIASETITNAEAFLGEIRKKLQSETFVRVFGNIIDPRTDRADAMNLLTRRVYSKEANIEAAGLGKAITGRHYDVVVADDIAGVQDRDSAAKRTITFAFFNDIMDVLKKDIGFLRVIGTRWHREDIYGHIKNRLAPDMARRFIGEFNIWEKPAHDDKTMGGTLNFPRLLPEKKLQELRTVKQGRDGIDISTYMAQYELEPLSSSEQIFKSLQYYNIKEVVYEHFILWTDPALSDKSSACYSAICVLGKIKDAPWYGVCYASMDKRAPQKIKQDHNRIAKMHQDLYGAPVYAYMEENGFQLLLVGQTNEDSKGVQTIGRRNSENKIARIRSMEPFVSQGFIRFRDDWETAPEGYRLLIEQLLGFPQGMIDGPDALQSAHAQSQRGFNYCRTVLPDGQESLPQQSDSGTSPDAIVTGNKRPVKNEYNFMEHV